MEPNTQKNKTSAPRNNRPMRRGRSNSQSVQRNRGGFRPRTNNTRSSEGEFRAIEQKVVIPDPGENLRIIPIGGVEQIGQNMTAIEYKDTIIVIDAGIQFADPDHPGVDYIIPNTKYLEERKDKIRGIFITHGHLDHIGALPFLIEKIGNPPIFSRQFGAAMILKRHEEFPHLPKLQMNIVDPEDVIRVGAFVVRSFAISHTIPDSMGLIIETPMGEIAFIEDVRVDNIEGIPTEEEVEQYKRFKDREMLMLTMDSTSIEKRGFSLSEQVVVKNIIEIIRTVPGRMIIASFASQVERIVAIIEAAEKFGKKVVIEGRSMKTNVEISKKLGIINATNIISLEEMEQYPPNKILMLVTGSQGEEFAALVRIANKTHKHVRLQPTDTILLSSSVVPGNDRDVDRLKDNLYRSGAKIITYRDSDVHASGHGNREELAWIHKQIKYRFFMPVHGNHYMLAQHAELAQSLGAPKENIVIPDNGSIIEITPDGQKISVRKEKAPNELVMVDGFSIGNIQNVVIRDRQMLAQDGMFIVIVVVDAKTGRLRKSPDIISRAFVYLKESQELLHHARGLIKRTVESASRNQDPINFDYVKNTLTDTISKYLYQKTAKRPLVIPVVLAI